ncbi:MAG TPA: S53 family peptidase [Candidatus Sulfotelmatobacter sp.]|nr:S53 family peptidase [Candidatus Sulfotelmatobacter sp.]
MRSWKFLLPLLATSLCFAAQPDRITGAINSGQAVVLAKSLHPKAKPEYDQGPVDPSLKLTYMTMLMAPSPTQQKALDQLLAQQQNPKSPNYHKWLTPQQFADQFGLSQNDLNKVIAWLKSQGFQILRVGGSRNTISFSGTAVQVESAFRTEIHNYKVDGEVHFANSTPLMIPSMLNGIVSGIMGIHTFFPKPASQGRGARGVRNSHPNYYVSSLVFPNFLAPDDIATIYDITPLYSSSIDGSGQTLGIIGQTDVYLADLNDFRSGFGLNQITGCTTNTNGVITACNSTYFQYVPVGTDTGIPSTCGDLTEADLDLEWSGAVARNAQIVFFNSPVTYNAECTGITAGGGVNQALIQAIDPTTGSPLAKVLSMSYGSCEPGSDTTLESILKQGNSEGITIMNSSGDQGAAACDYSPPGNPTPANPPFGLAQFGLAVNYPASSPEVTGVGGTSISLANDSYPTQSPYWSTSLGPEGGTAVSYIPEQSWNDDVEFADYCQDPISGDTFCSTGGGVQGWVPLSTSATAAQLQTDIWINSSGGGASNCAYVNGSGICLGAGAGPNTGGGFAQPSYQQSLVVPGAPAGVRYVPDVSMMASPDFAGYIYCTPVDELSSQPPYDTETTSSCASGILAALNSGNYVSAVGGTSASTPVFAGIVTLLNQAMGGSQGNFNPTLYELAATPSNGIFHAITSGNNNVYCAVNTPANYPANVMCTSSGVIGFSASNADPTTGYNLVNGLGSVDADKLVGALTVPDFNFSAGALSPSSVPAGQSTTATLTISALTAGSTPMVVNFSPSNCSGLPTGASCSFNPISVNFDGVDSVSTVVTISTLANMTVPTSAQTITITPTNSPKTPATVSLTVGATNQSFSMASTGATFSVAAGATASVPITVSGTGSPLSFVNSSSNTTVLPVTYTCLQSSIPSEATCTFSPGVGSAVSATSITLSIATAAPTAQLRSPLGRSSRIFYALLLPGLFGIVFGARSRNRSARLLGLIVVLGLSTLGLGSCGSSNGSSGGQKNPGTPAGSYTIVVNATTAGPNALTATPLKITLNVTN